MNCSITNIPENKLEPDYVNAPDGKEQMQRQRDIVREYFDYHHDALDDLPEHVIIVRQINVILMDAEDDKLGRIKDLMDAEKNKCVDFVIENKTHGLAQFHFNEAMRLYE